MNKHNGRRRLRSYEQLLKDDPSGMTMLDQALEGATAEEKARVRGVLLRFGIEPDHEFYVIFVAIGQLLVLVEEAPEKWRALFDDVHQELKQWSRENFKSLESIKHHAQTSAELITVLRRLLDSMKVSDNRSNEMRSTLSSLSLKLTSIENSLASMQALSRQSSGRLSQIEGQIETLTEFANRRDWISIFSGIFGAATVGLLLLNNWTMARRLDTQELLLRRQTVRIDWLLEKASRQECFLRVKPPSDPQCQQYQ